MRIPPLNLKILHESNPLKIQNLSKEIGRRASAETAVAAAVSAAMSAAAVSAAAVSAAAVSATAASATAASATAASATAVLSMAAAAAEAAVVTGVHFRRGPTPTLQTPLAKATSCSRHGPWTRSC